MMIARGDQRLSPQNRFLAGCLLYGYPADRVEPLGESCGEYLRHMLHHHNTGRVQRQGLQKLGQSFGPSRRRAHHHNLFGGLDHGV